MVLWNMQEITHIHSL